MHTRRRGGAFALLLSFALAALALAGCHTNTVPLPGGASDRDLSVSFQECDSVCIRPGDCAQAFNDDGICPPGFLCATRFTCSPATD